MSNPFIVNKQAMTDTSHAPIQNNVPKTSFEVSSIYEDYEPDIDDDLQDLVAGRKRNDQQHQQQQRQQYDKNGEHASHYHPTIKHYMSILCNTVNYHLQYICYYYPIPISIITISFVSGCLWILFAGVVMNSTQQYGVIDDFYNISSKYDLSMTKIKHYCLGGGMDCTCDDPLVPLSRSEHASWIVAYQDNLQKLKQYSNEVKGMKHNQTSTYLTPKIQPTVAFVGESVSK
jgi:hypothetical protein